MLFNKSWAQRKHEVTRNQVVYLLCAVGVGVWAIFNAIRAIHYVIGFYTPIPVRDYWSVVERLDEYRAFHIAVLWKQHNDHRIVLPETVFAMDMLTAHGLMILPLIVSSISYFAAWIVLAGAALSEKCIPAPNRLLAVTMASVVAAFESVTLVLAAPFLLQWTFVQLFAVISFFFFSRFKETGSMFFLGGTIAAATAATFSSLNGLVLWPLLILFAVLFRRNIRHVLIFTLAAAINYAVYFTGYEFRADSNFWVLIVHPLHTAEFTAAYLSLPFGSVKAPGFAIFLGFLNLAGAIALFVFARRRRLLGSKIGILLCGYYAFTLFTGMAIAGGRIDVTDTSFFSARSVRYISIPQMNWAALIMATLLTCSLVKMRRMLFPAFLLVFILLCSAGLTKLDRWFGVSSVSFRKIQETAARVERGEMDRQSITQNIYSDFHVAVMGLSRLREDCLSVYYRSCYQHH